MQEGKMTVYRASDGTLHNSHREFARHKAGIFIEGEIKSLMMTDEGSLPSQDDAGNVVLFEEDLPRWINANAEALRAILDTALTVRRGGRRKAKQ